MTEDGDRGEDAAGSDDRLAVQAGYDVLAADYDAARTAEDPPWLDLLDEFEADLPDGARVLDVGCGSGRPVATRLGSAGHDVLGLDISTAMLALAREHADAALAAADMTRLPVRDGAADGAVAAFSVIHVPREDHGEVFAEFHRALRPGGRLLVTLGDDAWEGENSDWLETGAEMRWSFHDLETSRGLLEDAGFTVDRVERVPETLGGDDDGVWAFALCTA